MLATFVVLLAARLVIERWKDSEVVPYVFSSISMATFVVSSAVLLVIERWIIDDHAYNRVVHSSHFWLIFHFIFNLIFQKWTPEWDQEGVGKWSISKIKPFHHFCQNDHFHFHFHFPFLSLFQTLLWCLMLCSVPFLGLRLFPEI